MPAEPQRLARRRFSVSKKTLNKSTRALLVNQRTQVINALRGHLSEFGIIAAAGTTKVAGLISIVRDGTNLRLSKAARLGLMEVASQIDALKAQIEKLEQAIVATVKRDDDARRVVTIPGVGDRDIK